MREIKFRAWDKNTNTMYENISILPSMECIAINVDYDHDFQEYCIDESYVVELKDVELLEYTGLKDKNGVEIYEGDIVRRPAYSEEERDYIGDIVGLYHIPEKIGEVIMYEGAWCLKFELNEKKVLNPFFEMMEFDRFDLIEVIGNIYENKELLEVE